MEERVAGAIDAVLGITGLIIYSELTLRGLRYTLPLDV